MRFCPACHLLGQAISTIVSAVAQLERDLIRERVSAGVRHARACANRLADDLRKASDEYAKVVHELGSK
jgi:DNA invertase Pin-like site-specific DNA recombinase